MAGILCRVGMCWSVVMAASAACAGEAGSQELLFPNSDFEMGDLTNWKTEEQAFNNQPTHGDNVRFRRNGDTAMAQGDFWVGSYENYQGQPGQTPGGVQSDGPRGGLYSVPFTIREPFIAFLVGGGCLAEIQVQLVLGGSVTRSTTGAFSEAMRRVIWDVSEYQGEKAMIYIIDHGTQAWEHISADDFRFLSTCPDRLLFPNSDFELGDLSNWTSEGSAFTGQPEKVDQEALGVDPLKAPAPTGRYWARSGAPDEAKTAGKVGSLKSIPFTVKGRLIAFQVRGGNDDGLKVELLVEGERVHWLYGIHSPSMRNIAWGVDSHLGKTAELVITDGTDKPGADIAVDNFHYGRLD